MAAMCEFVASSILRKVMEWLATKRQLKYSVCDRYNKGYSDVSYAMAFSPSELKDAPASVASPGNILNEMRAAAMEGYVGLSKMWQT